MESVSDSKDLPLTSTSVNVIDVLIIGAGPIGLASALWFAQNSFRVVLLEQYGQVKTESQRAFNERHQQVGINPKSLKFLQDLNIIVWGNIKTRGCTDQDWINIPIYVLQDIFCKEIGTLKNVQVLFNTQIESVSCFNPKHNARVLVSQNNKQIYAFYPELIIVADGRHDEKGTARQFFNFPIASKVHFSTYGVIGTMERNNSGNISVCLNNYTLSSYTSEVYPQLGTMHIRLLGSIQERYVALGVADISNLETFKNLTSAQIYEVLKEAYNRMRDINMGEPEFEGFREYSKSPIPIILDYRKETIKILDGSTTIVSVEGDAARKTTFFSGSGLNSGYEGLSKLFEFCQENKEIIFSSIGDANHLLNLDQKLLEKDVASIGISLNLLIKGSNFINTVHGDSKTLTLKQSIRLRKSQIHLMLKEPKINKLSPTKGEVSSHMYIKGYNLIGDNFKCPTITFSSRDGVSIPVESTTVYDNNTIGAKVPKNIEGEFSVVLVRSDGQVITSPMKFTVIKVSEPPEIFNIKKKKDYIRVDGNNFIKPIHVTVTDSIGEYKIKGYSSSINSLVFSPTRELSGKASFVVSTSNGDSALFEKEFIKKSSRLVQS